jgi:hypothetical protein
MVDPECGVCCRSRYRGQRGETISLDRLDLGAVATRLPAGPTGKRKEARLRAEATLVGYAADWRGLPVRQGVMGSRASPLGPLC